MDVNKGSWIARSVYWATSGVESPEEMVGQKSDTTQKRCSLPTLVLCLSREANASTWMTLEASE